MRNSVKWLLLFVVLISLIPGKETAAETSLQSEIEAIPEGGTLHLKAGVYNKPIVLTKPIVVEGEKGTVFQVCSAKPVITIKGKEVRISGIKIVNCQKGKNITSIYITGQGHELQDITLDAGEIGIQMEDTEKTTLRNITIIGHGKANGIELWGSQQNIFTGLIISHVQDGFYMENSPDNTFIGNTISDSRYGLHVMYSDHITAIMNKSVRNYTGTMIMGTTKSVLKGNQLLKNKENVNAQGMLLYEVYNSSISENRIEQNRVGLFMEDSTGNEIVDNDFSANFIGTQLNRIENNIIEGNTFTSNVTDIQATEATNNTIQKNYWDASLKLDTDGDGKSNLFHRADPFFLSLATQTPAYQLFFQHPGLLLLQKMLKSPDELLVTDQAPLMENEFQNQVQNSSQPTILWGMSMVMILSSLLIIYIGRKKA